MTTKVTNLSTEEIVEYRLSPSDAVVKAFKDHHVGSELPALEYGRCTVICGNWCALVVPMEDAGRILIRREGEIGDARQREEALVRQEMLEAERQEVLDEPDIYSGDNSGDPQ